MPRLPRPLTAAQKGILNFGTNGNLRSKYPVENQFFLGSRQGRELREQSVRTPSTAGGRPSEEHGNDERLQYQDSFYISERAKSGYKHLHTPFGCWFEIPGALAVSVLWH